MLAYMYCYILLLHSGWLHPRQGLGFIIYFVLHLALLLVLQQLGSVARLASGLDVCLYDRFSWYIH